MAVKSNHVTIKGIKDGLVFLLDDECEFEELLGELRYKLEHTHQNILTGPIIHVDVKLGSRRISEDQKQSMLDILKQKGNLLIRSVEMPEGENEPGKEPAYAVMSGMVRSGQVLHHHGDLLFLGDVNPGGSILCTGDIYILGALRGMAHAGVEGNEEAIIAASYFAPTQLRIAERISRPPDEWNIRETSMEFAFLRDGAMQIDKISNIVRIRRDFNVFKGV
ncbi:septum site-determining protein MinC [Paenibacillus cellulositrophicus]|jgi:septum site-determining protein MinC|uniref:Probable septum site-determining protein MinC n=3 Tax=Paenibacillus TaxID=44249 RepID=A0A1R1EF06_9BACL|nr:MULTISPECIES: septum site-determining protein MinC [Paenibacillus]MBJ9992166.1 septum site-determining protein MinC [Paenibacillus sp. S28]MCM3001982.1 septum site-determining protein MinC [Paenibacillus cellulositrophicus]MEC0175997.1 septum site-determining protein MinC [Paenibacillus favisporus]OMF50425.1 septum site-determining protein MinC [Paenibacillus rhizosphaerae]PQP85770.1 septum site-determining protein MinC [Paenibacillus sp. AR247]